MHWIIHNCLNRFHSVIHQGCCLSIGGSPTQPLCHSEDELDKEDSVRLFVPLEDLFSCSSPGRHSSFWLLTSLFPCGIAVEQTCSKMGFETMASIGTNRRSKSRAECTACAFPLLRISAFLCWASIDKNTSAPTGISQEGRSPPLPRAPPGLAQSC